MSERSSKQVLAPFTNPLLAPFPSSIARSLAGPLHIICVHACALALPPHDSLALVSSCPPGLHSSLTCSIPPLQSAFKLLHHLRGDSFAETLCCCVRQAGSRFLSNGGGRQNRQQVFVRKRPRSPPPPLSAPSIQETPRPPSLASSLLESLIPSSVPSLPGCSSPSVRLSLCPNPAPPSYAPPTLLSTCVPRCLALSVPSEVPPSPSAAFLPRQSASVGVASLPCSLSASVARQAASPASVARQAASPAGGHPPREGGGHQQPGSGGPRPHKACSWPPLPPSPQLPHPVPVIRRHLLPAPLLAPRPTYSRIPLPVTLARPHAHPAPAHPVPALPCPPLPSPPRAPRAGAPPARAQSASLG